MSAYDVGLLICSASLLILFPLLADGWSREQRRHIKSWESSLHFFLLYARC